MKGSSYGNPLIVNVRLENVPLYTPGPSQNCLFQGERTSRLGQLCPLLLFLIPFIQLLSDFYVFQKHLSYLIIIMYHFFPFLNFAIHSVPYMFFLRWQIQELAWVIPAFLHIFISECVYWVTLCVQPEVGHIFGTIATTTHTNSALPQSLVVIE